LEIRHDLNSSLQQYLSARPTRSGLKKKYAGTNDKKINISSLTRSKYISTPTPPMLDFKLRTRPCNTSPLDSSKNSTFLAINHREISFDADKYKGGKRIPHRVTIIRPLQAGWSAAPYKKNQKGVPTKRLSEISTIGEEGPVVKMYSFDKGSTNMDKGPRRDEYTFELRQGNALNFWLDEQRLMQMKKDQPALPECIAAFTVCEIHVASKNVDGVAKGSACKIVDIKPRPFTLYSCMEVRVV